MTDRDLLELRVEMTAHVEMNNPRINTVVECWVCGGEALQHYTKSKYETGIYSYTHCQEPECGQFDTEFIGPDV